MPNYVKRPLVIEAHQWTGENTIELATWCKGFSDAPDKLSTRTLTGKIPLTIGDYIIKDSAGDFYPVTSDYMDRMYCKV